MRNLVPPRHLQDPKTKQLAGSVGAGATRTPISPVSAGAPNPYQDTSGGQSDAVQVALTRRIQDQQRSVRQEEDALTALGVQGVTSQVRRHYPDATHVTVLNAAPELAGRRAIMPLAIYAGEEELWVHPDDEHDRFAADLYPYTDLLNERSPQMVPVPVPGDIAHYRVQLEPSSTDQD
jgi:hypothetical protein